MILKLLLNKGSRFLVKDNCPYSKGYNSSYMDLGHFFSQDKLNHKITRAIFSFTFSFFFPEGLYVLRSTETFSCCEVEKSKIDFIEI